MSTIPITWVMSILAVLLGVVIAVNRRLPPSARAFLCLGLASMAVVALFIGLRLEYGMRNLGLWQPHVALVTAPALWLGFHALTAQEEVAVRTYGITFSLVALAQAALLLPVSWSADLVVSAINLVYALALAAFLRKPPEAFVHVAPHGGRTLRVALVGATVFILLLVAADASILVATLSAGEPGMVRLLSGVSGVVVLIVVIGAFIAVPLAMGAKAEAEDGDHAPAPQGEDLAMFGRIEALMTESRIYADPALTLARLGRRLGVPAREVSVAVNRVTGDNVSRYINAHRIRRAAELLSTTTLPVTEIMLEVGFQSKSTFNTEFRRIYNQTPTEHRKSLPR